MKMKVRFAQMIFPVNLALGLMLPWATALAVRAWLIHLGKPVMPWSWIAAHVPLFALLALPFVAPFFVCGLWARRLLGREELRHRAATTGAVVGATAALSRATIWLHWAGWQDVSDPMVFIVMPVFVFGGSIAAACIGGIAGYVIGRLIEYGARAGSA